MALVFYERERRADHHDGGQGVASLPEDQQAGRYCWRSAHGCTSSAALTANGSVTGNDATVRFSALFGALISLFVEWTEGSLGTDRDAFASYVTAVATQLMSEISSAGTTCQ
ncbi:hypothetical protein [Nocardia abscessus]|uniref:hypothetical protein n=1 Tax=Nocardia abscessus TaxID=120957 RepID=UPI002453928A|nr:hypothetical protein [Nocardia abscessus]